jgi:hypothetical protein
MKQTSAFFALLTALGIGAAACTQTQLSSVQRTARVGCLVDGVVQPLAAGVLSSIPQTAAVGTLDQTLVHPLVVAACAKVNGTPVAAVPTVTAPVPAS